MLSQGSFLFLEKKLPLSQEISIPRVSSDEFSTLAHPPPTPVPALTFRMKLSPAAPPAAPPTVGDL